MRKRITILSLKMPPEIGVSNEKWRKNKGFTEYNTFKNYTFYHLKCANNNLFGL
jgi:hypothetical protein